MHNSDISDEKFFKLNDLANREAYLQFKPVFWKLTNSERTQYILETRTNGSARSMTSILIAIKDENGDETKKREEMIATFTELLECNTGLAFNTLNNSYHKNRDLFRVLFDKLGEYENKYVQHLQQQNAFVAGNILQNFCSGATPQMNIPAQGVASSKSYTISDEKITELNKLASRRNVVNFREALSILTEQDRQAYIHITGESKTIRHASNLLKAIEKEKATLIFQQWLSGDDKKFAFAVLTDIHDYSGLYKVLFAELGEYKNKYMQYLQQQNTTVASNILKNFHLYTASTSALSGSTTNATPQMDTPAQGEAEKGVDSDSILGDKDINDWVEKTVNYILTGTSQQVDTQARKRARHEGEIPIAHPPAALGHANQINATSTGTLSQVYTTARKRARHAGEIPIAHPPAALGHANHQIEGSNNLSASPTIESVMVQEIIDLFQNWKRAKN